MPEPDPTTDWWVTSDVAAYLGVSISTVSTYKARGQMPAPDRTFGRTPAWRPASIIEWHDKRPGHGGRPPNRPPSDIDRPLQHALNDVEQRSEA
jgi:predicted DNA-binding transcriptional regulator AlpA